MPALKSQQRRKVLPAPHLKIFLSYNPDVEIEQSTALRLQTLGALYGVEIYLPDRYGAHNTLKGSTKQRIEEAHVCLMFMMSRISPPVRAEVNFAHSIGKQVIVFYDKKIPRFRVPPGVIAEPINPYSENATEILARVLTDQRLQKALSPAQAGSGLAALVAVGVGLFALWALSKDDDE